MSNQIVVNLNGICTFDDLASSWHYPYMYLLGGYIIDGKTNGVYKITESTGTRVRADWVFDSVERENVLGNYCQELQDAKRLNERNQAWVRG